MKTNLVVSILLAILQVSSSWVISKNDIKKAFSIASISAAICTAPLVANSADFNGSYDDPFHPNCVRSVEVYGQKLVLSGTDGNPGCPADGGGKPWVLPGTLKGDGKILVDFTPKGGPKDLEGVWEGGDAPGIRWPDGNKWTMKN